MPLPLTQPWMDTRLHDPARLRRGLLALAGIGVAYAICMLLLALGEVGPGPAPWLVIPRETYFYWESTFILPVIFLGGLLAAATLHLLARALGGSGSFDDTMALVGVSVALSTLWTVLPDTVVGLLLIGGVIDPALWMQAISEPGWVLALIWVYLLAYLASFLWSFRVVAHAVYALRGYRALLAGWTSFAVYQLFLYVFIR